MKKKHRHNPKRKHATRVRPRNASTGLALAAPRTTRSRAAVTPRESTAPHWKSIAAAVIGGALGKFGEGAIETIRKLAGV